MQTNFNIDDLKTVHLNRSFDTSLTPKGVNFPDGTQWRKPIKLHSLAAPAADVIYRCGSLANMHYSEHTGADIGYTRTPRWRDTDIEPYVNFPSDWVCPIHHKTIDQVLIDPSDSSSVSSDILVERGVLKPLWYVKTISINANGPTFNASVEIYNPGTRAVSYDICDAKTDNSCGALVVSGWSTAALASSRIIDSKSRITITIKTNVTHALNGFKIKFYDKYYIANQASYVTDFVNEHLIPVTCSSTSSKLPGCYQKGSTYYPDGQRLGGLDIEVRHVYNSSSGLWQPYSTMTNPFSSGFNYRINRGGPPGMYYPEHDELPEDFYIAANTTKTSMIKSPIYGEISDFTFIFATSGASCNQSAISLERKIYPPVVTIDSFGSARGHGGDGSTASLTFYNPNAFAVKLNSQIYIDHSAVDYTLPAQGLSIAARSSYSMKMTFTDDFEGTCAIIDGDCYFYGTLPENSEATSSEMISFDFCLTPTLEPPSVQAADMLNGYDVQIDIANENTHRVLCYVLVHYVTQEWRDDWGDGGVWEDRHHYITAYKYIGAESSKTIKFSLSDSVSDGDAEYTVWFYYPNSRMASTAVEGYFS